MAQKLDYSDAWDEIRALIIGHKEAVLAIAGVFVFLPTLIFGQFAVEPDTTGITDSDQVMQLYATFFAQNGLLLLILTVFSLLGSVALYVVFLRDSITIGEALKWALILIIPFVAMSILMSIAIGIGFVLLIIPGIYFAIKFSLAGAVIVAQDVKNPITALGRSWKATKGNSLRIFGFLLILLIVGVVALLAIGAVVGIPVNLLLPTEAALFVNNLVNSLLSAMFSVVFLAAYSAIYRQLTGSFDQRELEETF